MINKFQEILESLELLKENVLSLEKMVKYDLKTGVLDFSFFEEFLKKEFEKSQRTGETFSLIMLDIDSFKKINDTLGHMKGDELLLDLAKVFKKYSRKYDLVSRFGGDEFYILLPATDLNLAEKVAKRISKGVEKKRSLKKEKITISMGVTSLRKEDSLKELKMRVDKALYKSKEDGKNKITVFI